MEKLINPCDYCNIVTSCYDFNCKARQEYVSNVITEYKVYIDIGLTPEEVKELTDLKEKGILIKLPCKVGDEVYRIGKPCRRGYNGCGKVFTKEGDINYWCEDECKEKDVVFTQKFDLYCLSSIGETVFLTLEEAKKALESEQE